MISDPYLFWLVWHLTAKSIKRSHFPRKFSEIYTENGAISVMTDTWFKTLMPNPAVDPIKCQEPEDCKISSSGIKKTRGY